MRAVAERPTLASPCRACDAAVIVTVTPAGARKTLDAGLTPGGLYSLDSSGRAVRRRMNRIVGEVRGLIDGGGHAVHDCPGVPRVRWN